MTLQSGHQINEHMPHISLFHIVLDSLKMPGDAVKLGLTKLRTIHLGTFS